MTPKQKKDVMHYVIANVLAICAFLFWVQDEKWDVAVRGIFVIMLFLINTLVSLYKME